MLNLVNLDFFRMREQQALSGNKSNMSAHNASFEALGYQSNQFYINCNHFILYACLFPASIVLLFVIRKLSYKCLPLKNAAVFILKNALFNGLIAMLEIIYLPAALCLLLNIYHRKEVAALKSGVICVLFAALTLYSLVYAFMVCRSKKESDQTQEKSASFFTKDFVSRDLNIGEKGAKTATSPLLRHARLVGLSLIVIFLDSTPLLQLLFLFL